MVQSKRWRIKFRLNAKCSNLTRAAKRVIYPIGASVLGGINADPVTGYDSVVLKHLPISNWDKSCSRVSVCAPARSRLLTAWGALLDTFYRAVSKIPIVNK